MVAASIKENSSFCYPFSSYSLQNEQKVSSSRAGTEPKKNGIIAAVEL
jgi:hypothetical protein